MNATHDDQDDQPGLAHNADEQAAPPGLTRNKADGVTPGEILHEGRLAHDYSVDDLCVQTKLSPHTVEALEGNDFGSLSQPVFARGYYRQCAKVLDLDVERLMAAYTAIAGETPTPRIGNDSVGAGAIPQDVTPGRGFRLRGLFVLLAIVVVVIAAIVFVLPSNGVPGAFNGDSDSGSQGDDNGDDQSGTAFESSVGNDDNGAADNKGSATTAGTGGDRASTTPDVVGNSSGGAHTATRPGGRNVNKTLGVDLSGENDDQNVQDKDASQSSRSSVPPGRLVLTFNKRSWVRVTDADGDRLASGIFEAGDEKKVNGKPPYKVTLGFAPGVEATIGGEPVDIAAKANGSSVAHFTVDAPDGPGKDDDNG